MIYLNTLEEWQSFYTDHPVAHILQAPEWGLLKCEFGWEPVNVRTGDCGAQVLFKRLPMGFSAAYIAKGPIGENWRGLWPAVDEICRQKKAVFLKVEPDLWEVPEEKYEKLFPGFIKTDLTVQPRRTVVINLEGGEKTWLSRMKQKTRYNIKLAERKYVRVEISNNVEEFYSLAQVTGSRDGFGIHTVQYYQRAFDLFSKKGLCSLHIAKYNDQPLAGLMVFMHGRRAWYLYGASNDVERNRMPAYLVQQAAMKWAYERGCLEYDLWGIPDYDEEFLESNFETRQDGLWGVYRFKRGFGGKNMRSAGAWEKVYNPLLYRAYLLMMKRRGIQGG